MTVVSVKSCCRPRITIRNPIEYPKLSISRAQGASGRLLRINASVRNDSPIDNPAASPDQHSALTGRFSPSSPSCRNSSWITSARGAVCSAASFCSPSSR